jgi:anaerobic magnesium-protoporphyrin IX monomethyl ester cyclase
MDSMEKYLRLSGAIDVLFINPPSPDRHVYIRDINRSGRRSRERTLWPQTSLAYLAAVARGKGLSVDVIDCIALRMSWSELKKVLEKASPRVVVTNAISSIISNDLQTTFLGKFFGAATVAIGPHVTSLPRETLERFPSLDVCILGEAEATVAELVPALIGGKPLGSIRGIAYRGPKGRIRITPRRPFIENLDDLPMPLHELLPIKSYRLPYIGSSFTFVLASRGCPYQCTFCRQPIMWERKVRKRSARSILRELACLDGIGVRNIMFHADTFTIDREIVMDLCRGIVDRRLPVRWICNSRVDTVDSEMLAMMKRAGCWMIAYGVETGSDEILRNVKKGGRHTVQQARDAVAWTRNAGIEVWAYFIMGLPGESRRTVRETIAFARSLPADIVNFAVGAPYPGTELLTQARENGWLESEAWEDFDQNYSAILSYPGFSSGDTMKSIRRAYLEWYLRPKGAVAFLKGIRSWRDLGTLAGIGLDHLRISKSGG